MSRRIAVLRPEPGNAATAAALAEAGLQAVRLPLFTVAPVSWRIDDAARFDALVFTSANAVRHGGAMLAGVRHLPVVAVGEATARAATDAGFAVIAIGDGGADALAHLLAAHGVVRALHLGGRDRMALATGVAQAITVYRSDPLPIAPGTIDALGGTVALLHSSRAARQLDRLIDRQRATIRLAAISVNVAHAAGTGWEDIAVAAEPREAPLIAAAGRLAD